MNWVHVSKDPPADLHKMQELRIEEDKDNADKYQGWYKFAKPAVLNFTVSPC